MRDRCDRTKDILVSSRVSKRRRLQRGAAPRQQRFAGLRDALWALADLLLHRGNTKHSGLARIMQPLSDREAVVRERQEAELLQSLSRRSHPPAYASRSTLESLVLLQARLRMWGIKAVMIDYAMFGSSEGINWRVTGFISGMADRDAASFAITTATHKYAKWVLVDDASPLAGQLVRLRPAAARGVA